MREKLKHSKTKTEVQPLAVCWFRQDLRLRDNPALRAACQTGLPVLPVYILDDDNPPPYAVMGEASRLWLHHSLLSLNQSLEDKLACYSGNPPAVFNRLSGCYAIKKIFWNRCYEPWRQKCDDAVKEAMRQRGIAVETHNGSLLWEPWDVLKPDKTPYQVFTPFYRKGCLLNASPPRKPVEKPAAIALCDKPSDALTVGQLSLLPAKNWVKKVASHWRIGEQAAQQKLSKCLEPVSRHYQEGRDLPAKPYTSKLSPHLRFGEVSPNQVWHAVQSRRENRHTDCFCSELGWREFAYNQLFYNPALPEANLKSKFDSFPWREDKAALKAWQQGQTGVPMVDAGMRELWQTGAMHNRVRMIAASFLVKNLLLHWRHGQAWFWDCLVDADLASNSAGWQWVAGCGADAAPYFRIFNPVTQGQKFDPEGEYVRRFVPEIKNLPNRHLFSPWQAGEDVLAKARITLGETYPLPVVDLQSSRQRALDAFQSLKNVRQCVLDFH